MTERSAYERLVQDGDLGTPALVDGAARDLSCGAVYGRPRARARVRRAPVDCRRELARLQLALDPLDDLVLGRVGVGAPQLPCAQPLELEDLEHDDEVDARRQHEQRRAPTITSVQPRSKWPWLSE